jgi:5'-AMP-activated protein kinase regulatory gamma subunit
MPDPLGNVNNWLFVRRPDGGGGGGDAPGGAAAPAPPPPAPPAAAPPPPALPPPPAPAPVPSPPRAAGPPRADGVMAPLAGAAAGEPEGTRRRAREFLAQHTAYELVPESGRVVVLDADLPVRQAFLALADAGAASAPLYDAAAGAVTGVISASDFAAALARLRSAAAAGAGPLGDEEMDELTIRDLRAAAAAEGRPPRPLVAARPGDSLAAVVRALLANRCSSAPVLAPPLGGASGPTGAGAAGPEVLHVATLAGVLACLLRHFRASPASLPALARPLGELPLGTWAAGSAPAAADAAAPPGGGGPRRRVAPIRVVTPATPVAEALALMDEARVSALPVVDAGGGVIDVWARADVTALARGNAYSRLQFEEVTVGQALALAAAAPWGGGPGGGGGGGAGAWGGVSPASSAASLSEAGAGAGAPPPARGRLCLCTAQDALRGVVERLAAPGVRRAVVVDPETRRPEGIVSLSDVAAFLLV